MTVPAADNLRHFAARPFAFKADAEAMEAAADLLDAIDALHQPCPDLGKWQGERRCLCDSLYPCPTSRLLHPEEGPS